jgi:hypothetical protein
VFFRKDLARPPSPVAALGVPRLVPYGFEIEDAPDPTTRSCFDCVGLVTNSGARPCLDAGGVWTRRFNATEHFLRAQGVDDGRPRDCARTHTVGSIVSTRITAQRAQISHSHSRSVWAML